MSRLFVRIWLTFWAVLVATVLVALAVDYGIAVERGRSIDRMSPQALAEQGAQVIAADGEAAGRRWILAQHSRLPELSIFIVAPDGRELTGRSPPEVARARGHAGNGARFPAAVTEAVRGRPYLFVFRRARSLAFDVWDVVTQPWVLAALVLAISGLGAAWLARSLTAPIQRLQAQVRSIAAGGLGSRMGPDLTQRGDELGALARDIDEMAARIQALIAAREAMLRDVSHELRAPLARLRAVADLARKRGGPEAAFARIDREIDRLDALIAQILRFSRLEAEADIVRAPVDLSDLLTEIVEDARLEAAGAAKTVELRCRGATTVLGDARLLRSAVENVLRNAVRFSPSGGAIEAALRAHGGMARITVLDHGPGVRPDELPRIFEAFHGDGSGAGLGLAIAQRVLRLHGGEIAAANRPGGGLSVSIDIPRLPAPSDHVRAVAASA
ncbi:HAMP domain-containing sensor histidine kinase [Phenylobacterium sp.]|jgi:two-component system sensor histidine kinase CpxA|uniref:HAMP domain-containing sensor histidine kinase n=1 Tax=Phenylobacterium sp. TaxID=1871053 RepID=UPI002F3FF288